MSLKSAFYSLVSLLVIISVIAVLWLLLWKFVLEPNPLIRDFFDLDVKPRNKKKE